VSKPSAQWKKWELYVCHLFGAERAGAVGRDGPDCKEQSYPLAIECKHGQAAPISKQLRAHMEQAVRQARELGPDWIPMLALHPSGTPMESGWACLRIPDLAKIVEGYRSTIDGDERV